MLQTRTCIDYCLSHSSPVLFPPQSPAGKSSPSAAARRVQASASEAEIERSGQTVLGRGATHLVAVEEFANHRHAGDGCRLASGRLPSVLETDLDGAQASWQKEAI